MGSLRRQAFAALLANGLPPSSPSNSFRIFPPPAVTLSPPNQPSTPRSLQNNNLCIFTYFQDAHFATPFFSNSCRNGGYPPAHPTKDAHPERPSGVEGFFSRFFSLLPKSFRRNTYTASHKCSFQRTYSNANFFRCNTYKKLGEGDRASRVTHCLATPRASA
jgi:hypothetical protein